MRCLTYRPARAATRVFLRKTGLPQNISSPTNQIPSQTGSSSSLSQPDPVGDNIRNEVYVVSRANKRDIRAATYDAKGQTR